MTGAELRKLREQSGLSTTQAAAAVSVSARTWDRWERAPLIPESKVKLASLALKSRRRI